MTHHGAGVPSASRRKGEANHQRERYSRQQASDALDPADRFDCVRRSLVGPAPPAIQYCQRPIRDTETQKCLTVAEALLQPGDRLPASTAGVVLCLRAPFDAPPSSKCVPIMRATANEPRIMQVWPGGLICQRAALAVGAPVDNGMLHTERASSEALRQDRKHPGHKSSRSSLALAHIRRGACGRSL